jgi:hypothetical protein
MHTTHPWFRRETREEAKQPSMGRCKRSRPRQPGSRHPRAAETVPKTKHSRGQTDMSLDAPRRKSRCERPGYRDVEVLSGCNPGGEHLPCSRPSALGPKIYPASSRWAPSRVSVGNPSAAMSQSQRAGPLCMQNWRMATALLICSLNPARPTAEAPWLPRVLVC